MIVFCVCAPSAERVRRRARRRARGQRQGLKSISDG